MQKTIYSIIEMYIMHKKPLALLLLFTTIIINTRCISTKMEVFFSPDDNVEQKLITYIKQAKKKIYAAVYMITSLNIAKALIAAKKRNLDVQIITDESCATARYGKIPQLEDESIEIFCLKHPYKKNAYSTPLMHHKFAIIDNIIWTGSFNWTKSANSTNQENVIITDAIDVYKRYEAQFSILKKRCFNTYQAKKDILYQPGYFEQFSTEIYKFLSSIKEKILG